jgi:hypothetical protein
VSQQFLIAKMISVAKARKILGKKYSHLDSEQLEVLLSKTYLLAGMAITLSDIKVFQSPKCFIDSQKEKKDD